MGVQGCPNLHKRREPTVQYLNKPMCLSEKEKRATAVALKLEEERKAGESARLAKAEQQRAVQQQQKQIAQEVCMQREGLHEYNTSCI